jgi:hypothetical protein
MGFGRFANTFCYSCAILIASAVTAYGQSQNTAFVGSGVSIAFQNAGTYTASAGVNIGFVNAGTYTASAGINIAFANASSPEGRGVSVGFGQVGTGGKISVTTNLAGATFNIKGPANYSGNGASFTVNNAPAGAYTITYGVVSCYGTPNSQTFTLAAGGSIGFNGSYTTTISVNITPAAATSATFSINPPIPGMRSTGPYPVNQVNVVPQPYTVTFNAVSGFQAPSPLTLSPGVGCSLAFTGSYTNVVPSAIGTLSMQSNLSQGAQFIIFKSGTTNIMAIGTGSVPIQLPAPAKYDVVYTAIHGYYSPLMQTVNLNPGDSVPLKGLYRRLILISFTGWNTAPNPSNCLPSLNPFNPIVGSGVQYPEAGWSPFSPGMISLLYEIQQNAALSPGALMAGFTFYSTDGSGNQLGNTCSSGIDNSAHFEAQNWFSAQNVTPDDIVAVVGHSYGGNRARHFVDDLTGAGLNVDFLATIDPIDWDGCDIEIVVGGFASLCDQSLAKRVHSANTALSLHQIKGEATIFGTFHIEGYTLSSSSSIANSTTVPPAVGDFHSDIDDDPNVHTTIKNSLLNLIGQRLRGPQVSVVPGTPTRASGTITIPITLSATGKGTAAAVSIVTASLNGISGSTPIIVGDIVAGAAPVSTNLSFPGTAAPAGATVQLNISGQFSYGQQFTSAFRTKAP